MADNKKYYYMRLNENYFDSETQVLLESMPDGYLYSNILLKLYLKSLKNDGRLMFNEKIPYSPQMIATITRHQIGTVEKSLKIFKELNIIDVIDTGAIYMLDIQNFIGKSNTEADRKRAYRKRIENEKGHLSLKCPLEIEKEIEIEIEIEKEQEIKEIEINKIYKYIEDNFGRILTPIEIQNIQSWLLLYDIKIIKYAIELSVKQGKRTFAYVEGILKNWKGCNLETIDDIINQKKVEEDPYAGLQHY